MADVYCDQELGTGSDNGTDWANAYKLLSSALDGTNTAAGDTLWVQGDQATSGSVTLKGVAAFTNNPPRVIGVIEGTSNTPPVAADIVPGLRNGSATRAYDQTAGNAAPIFATSVASSDIVLNGYFGLIYGLVLKARDNFTFADTVAAVINIEECELRSGDGETGNFRFGSSLGSSSVLLNFKNCKFSAGTDGRFATSGRQGMFLFENCIIDIPNSTLIDPGSMSFTFRGCDFPAATTTMITGGGGDRPQIPILFHNCQINSSAALATGSIGKKFRTEVIQTSSGTGKTTGESFLELDIITSEGDIVLETSRVRTGGASDGGDGAWSLAYTPGVNGTRDNLVGLIGPWLTQKIVGDGTAQTLTVHIANDLAESDPANTYNDDDVWLDVEFPSAAGTADWDTVTTQMDLEATPVQITTETETWGTGANNDQALSVSISPDYNGLIRWRVVFAKNFGATPDTLYVDPIGILS